MSEEQPSLGRSATSRSLETPSVLDASLQRARSFTNRNAVSPKSFHYRPTRPSLGYIFDNDHVLPPLADTNDAKDAKDGTDANDTKEANDTNVTDVANDAGADGRESRPKLKPEANSNATPRARSSPRKMRRRKTSTLSTFSETPDDQTLEAIKRELEFLKTEVPSFESRYEDALSSFNSTNHSKSRQVECAFIQALSAWIVEEGAPAMKELSEFKEDVQHEMTALVASCQEMSLSNQELNLLISDLQAEKEEMQQELTHVKTSLQAKEVELLDQEAEQLQTQATSDDVADMSHDLQRAREEITQLKQKMGRLESYLDQTQKDNDDLNRKTHLLQNEAQQGHAEVNKIREQMEALETVHERELMMLAEAHEEYKKQMEAEQAQIVKIAEDSQKQMQQMAMMASMVRQRTRTMAATPRFTDENSAGLASSRDIGSTLDAEYEQYVSSGAEELEWMDETDVETYVQVPLETEVLETTCVSVESTRQREEDFENARMSLSEAPEDATKAFVTEKEKTGVDLQDITKQFRHERKSYSQETKETDASLEFMSSKESVSVEETDLSEKHESWRAERGDLVDVAPVDPEASFVSEKKEFGVEPTDPTQKFTMQTQRADLQRADVSDTFKMEVKQEFRAENEALPFIDEKQSLNLNVQKKKSLELEISKTEILTSPQSKVTAETPVETPGTRAARLKKAPPPAHKRTDYTKFYDGRDEIIRTSEAFQKIMSKWKKDEAEKGGKPQILLQQAKQFELISKWNIRLEDQEKFALLQKKQAQKLPVNRSSTRSSRSTDKQSLIVRTSSRRHKLRPKLQGLIKIVRSHLVPKYQLKKEISFYLCFDGLPSKTNLDETESDKDRENDLLVPALFFFDSEQDFKQLYREAGAVPVRNAMFQKAFASRAKGVIPLHKHACDVSLASAFARLETKKGVQIGVSVEELQMQDVREETGNSLYVVGEKEFHRFEFESAATRDEWLRKVNG